jgi:HEAT repeat protein
LIDVGECRRSAPRSVAELFAAALAGDYEDEEAWDAVSTLRMRGTAEVYEAALQLCSSDDAKSRARGLDVLGQLGAGKPDAERQHLHDCISGAIRHLSDPDPTVVCSVAWALAHLNTKSAAAALIPLTGHKDQRVRHAVATALYGNRCASPGAVVAVLDLMQDPSNEVRDWATFALGQSIAVDSPEIRGALRSRLQDSYTDARDEAMWGLALRKDRLGLTLLLERLDRKNGWPATKWRLRTRWAYPTTHRCLSFATDSENFWRNHPKIARNSNTPAEPTSPLLLPPQLPRDPDRPILRSPRSLPQPYRLPSAECRRRKS